MAIGISALIGAALGLRLNVFVLIPTIILAGFATAVIQVASGHRAWSVVFTVVLVATTLQISYLIVSMARAAFERHVPLERNTDVVLNIQERMQVVGSDGEHVGTVDHTESADCIVLTGDDPKARGKSHVISVEWVDHVDSKVHLNKPSRKAVLEWRIQRHVGRDGISLRGLVDPFDLSAALKASAIHLRDLRNRFGNVGPSHVGVSPHVRRNPLSMAG